LEFSGGVNGPLPTHEWFYYVFDATAMFFANLIFAIWHPGRYLVGPDSEFPKKEKKKKNRRAQDDAHWRPPYQSQYMEMDGQHTV
jgi:hypothetical protein